MAYFGGKEKKKYNRFIWLAAHPEDQALDDENQRMRLKGYENDDVRNLMAGICLRACIDYKAASLGSHVDGFLPEYTLTNCHKFFGSEMFQWFVNGMPVEEIEEKIKATPKGTIHGMWKKVSK